MFSQQGVRTCCGGCHDNFYILNTSGITRCHMISQRLELETWRKTICSWRQDTKKKKKSLDMLSRRTLKHRQEQSTERRKKSHFGKR
jgi:hypothetical protein